MPIHRGPRLDDYISRLPYVAAPVGSTQWYQAWPYKAAPVTVGAGATAGTFGSWVELIAAASAPTRPFTVSIVPRAISTSECVVEVGIGGAGAEVAIANCTMGFNTHFGQPKPIPIIPGGSRVALRTAAYQPNGTIGGVAIKCYLVSCLLPTRLDSLNTLRMTRKLSSFYPGASPVMPYTSLMSITPTSDFVYSAWQQLQPASTESQPVILDYFNYYQDSFLAGDCIIALATGAAGSEVVYAEFPYSTLATSAGSENTGPHFAFPIPLIIPGGTRFSWRTANNSGRAAYQPILNVIRSPYQP